MLMKLLVSVFERAKSKITSTRPNGRSSSDSDNEFDTNNSKQIFSSSPSIIHQQPRISLSKWLCTNPSSVDKSTLSSKSNKIRRSSSWRSLKERGNNYIGHFTSRTLSVDELHRNQKKNSINKQQNHRQHPLSNSPIINLINQRQKPSSINSICLSNCDDISTSLSKTKLNSKRFNRLSSKKSQRKMNENYLLRNNTNSGGGDSGYSEESFATTTISSLKRPLHTSCPHCHCEQRSSFQNYKKSNENSSSTDSSTSDSTINKERNSSDIYYHIFQQKQSLSASRSYPHIKPLPKTTNQSQQKRTRSLAAKRRRHLSYDGSLWTKTQMQQQQQQQQQTINLTSTPTQIQSNYVSPLQRHFTTIGMLNYDSTLINSKPYSTLPKNSHVFGELNLAAIELDSIRTLNYHRPSFSSSYSSSLTSSSSSINFDNKKCHSKRKGTYLVWHEYKNSSLLSATNGTKIFSVIRGDQVRLLKRIGKSTLLVQKEDDGSIGFLPQSCLAHDQINSFLSVKGLKETVL